MKMLYMFNATTFLYLGTELQISATTFILLIGPSGVRALPVAAGTNEGGHYFRYWSGRVACASGATKVGHYFAYFSSCASCASSYFYTRRDCHRILNFCMGSQVTKIGVFQ